MVISNNKRADIVVIRVLSMIMIVLCHITRFYTFIPGSQLYGEIFNVGVDIFLAVSGFLYGRKTITDFPCWIGKRIQRVVIPVLLVVVLDFLVLACFFDIYSDAITTLVYLMNLQGLLFVNWDFFNNYFREVTNLGPLWFTTIIMGCYLLIPFFQIIRKKMQTKKNKVVIYGGVLCLLYISCFILKLMTHTVLFYFVVFFTGYILSDLRIDEGEYKRKRVFVLLILILSLMIGRVFVRQFIDGTMLYTTLISLGHSIIGIGLLTIGLELNKKYEQLINTIGKSYLVSFLDGASMYIYLVHGIFCMGATSIYGKINLGCATIIFVIATLLSARIIWFFTDLINNAIDKRFTCMKKTK